MRNKASPIPIPQYFAGQHIFMTGGTGFMGKVLVEKILRCCPEVEKIYLMIRPKKQKSIEERWIEMTNTELFKILKSSNPDAMKKIQLIPGDLNEDNLGLSEDTLTILRDKVTIIIHMAAMIQFRDQLLEAIASNTKATHVLLNMALSMAKLKVFVHVSTGYSNSNLPCEESVEEVLPAVQDWKVMLELCDREPLTIAFMKEKLLCGHPNPYTFSKSLAEQIVDDYKSYFPTVILRPGLIVSCNRDPIEGWVDVLSVGAALCLTSTLGLARVFYAADDSYLDFVPADTAINALILATAKRLSEPLLGKTDVYNCGIASEKKLTAYLVRTVGREFVEEFPSKYTIWPTHTFYTTNDILFKIMSLFFNVCPAILIDLVLLFTFNKPMVLNIIKKFSNVTRICKKFTVGQIAFPNDKFKALEHFLPDEEKKTFTISNDDYTATEILKVGYISMLRFILKEDLSEMAFKKNRRKLFWLKVLDKLVIYGICAWCSYKYLCPLWMH